MKVIRVNIGEKPEVIEIGSGLEEIRSSIGVEWIEMFYPFSDPVCIICDEEGKINGNLPNRELMQDGRLLDVIFGNFLIVGIGEEDVESVPEELVDKYMNLFTHSVVKF